MLFEEISSYLARARVVEKEQFGADQKRMRHCHGAAARLEVLSPRKRGQHIGRPTKLGHTQIEHAKELIDQGKSRNEVARLLSVNPSTLYRRLQATG